MPRDSEVHGLGMWPSLWISVRCSVERNVFLSSIRGHKSDRYNSQAGGKAKAGSTCEIHTADKYELDSLWEGVRGGWL